MTRNISFALAFLVTISAFPHNPEAETVSPSPVPATAGSLISQRLPRIEYLGGPFLRNPRIVTITFKTDDPGMVSRLEHFGDKITHTPWWRTVTEGYCRRDGDCIGEGQPGAHVRLDETLPDKIHAVDVSALLTREANKGTFDPLSADTLLLVYLPAGVTLIDAFVPQYCKGGPRAYHRALRLVKMTIPYAVMPRCSGEAELTATASHEILEATTNPDPAWRGFAFKQSSANLGFTAAGVEPVDPCGLITMDDHWIPESGFTVQRAWSNRAAEEGRNPCVPNRADRPYVVLTAEKPTVRLVKVGQSITIALEAAADRTVPAWAVSAFDLTGYQEQQHYVEVSLDKTTVKAGDNATLTITAKKRQPKELCIVGVVSTLGVYSYMWPIAVVMR